MGGGGGRPVDYNREWSDLSDAGKAAFYARSPIFSGATHLGQNIFGFTEVGMLQNASDPGFVERQKLIAKGMDPGSEASAQRAAGAFPGGSGPPPSGERGGGGGSRMGAGAAPSDGRAPPSGGGGSGFAYGGYVSMQDLQGPNPAGPDDGYAALKDGEYVINDQAVNKYGIELMNLINSGKISKGKLRGLLEM
jgi:hypothetical protein